MDHKPLLSIFGSKKENPSHTANRLQRWGTILLNYCFKMEFLPPKSLGHADGLSILIPKSSEPLEETETATLTFENKNRQIYHREKETNYRPIVQNDWWWKDSLHLWWNFWVQQMNGDTRSVERKRIWKDFHTVHPGIAMMKPLMRSYVLGPNMDKEIEDNVKCCKSCAISAKARSLKNGLTLVKAAYKFWRHTKGTISFNSGWQFLEIVRGNEI